MVLTVEQKEMSTTKTHFLSCYKRNSRFPLLAQQHTLEILTLEILNLKILLPILPWLADCD